MVFCRFLREPGFRNPTLAHVAQPVEHVLGKDEVISSILIMGSRIELFNGKPLQPEELRLKAH